MEETTQQKNSKCRRLHCKKCNKGLGYPNENQIKWYGTLRKLIENYICRRCRKLLKSYGKYLKKVREEN